MRERIRSEGEKGRTEGETRLREVDTEGVPTVVRTSEELGTDWPLSSTMPVCWTDALKLSSPAPASCSLRLFATWRTCPLLPNPALLLHSARH